MESYNHIKMETTESFNSYTELIQCYKQELQDCIVNKNGQRMQDTPLNRNILISIHDKYLQLQKQLFPNEKGEEFEHLYIATNKPEPIEEMIDYYKYAEFGKYLF